MAGEQEPGSGSEKRSDDLFEDLDQFFASIDESEWPDAEPVDEEAPPAPAAPPPEAPEPAELETPFEPPAAQDVPLEPEEEVIAPPPVAEGPLLPAEPLESATTREMSTDDWARLRDVLGEEGEEDDQFEFTEVPTELPDTPEESLFGYAGADPAEPQSEDGIEAEESALWEAGQAEGADMGGEAEPPEFDEGGLTLEDLKKAPPEYGELPREDDAIATAEEPLVPDVEEPFVAAEPTLADVEAAADHLAEEFLAPPDDVDEDLLPGVIEPEPVRRTVKVGEPESMLGPSWEDPTSQTVTTEAPPPQGGRNLPAAVITGALLGVAALIFVFISKPLFAVLAGAVVLIGQLELYTTMQRREYQPATALGLVMGGFTLAAAYSKGEPAMQFMLVLGLMLTFLWYMAAAPKGRTGLVANVGATFLGLAYAPFLAGYILVILTAGSEGRSLMLAVLGLTFFNDIMAFGFGSIWGSRPLAPTISPRKSLEGLLGGTAATILVAIAAVPAIDGMTVVRSLGLALVICVFAPLGDLAESVLKRDLGVKDMGNILPGHGGVLDRIDSALFVAPAAFYFLRLVF